MTPFSTLLIIISVPGIIAALIYGKITRHERWSPFTFSVYAVLFGWFSYLPLYFIPASVAEFAIVNVPLKNLPNIDTSIYLEVLWACVNAVILAFILAACAHYSLLPRLARLLRCSHKYGDETLFSFYLSDETIDWIYLRNSKKNRTYKGRVRYYSEESGIQEIILTEADIYTCRDSAYLYHAPEIYLCGKTGDFSIEPTADGRARPPGESGSAERQSPQNAERQGRR